MIKRRPRRKGERQIGLATNRVVIFELVFLVLAFSDFPLLRSHFWPLTEIVRKSRGEVTREVWEQPRITRISRTETCSGSPVGCFVIRYRRRVCPSDGLVLWRACQNRITSARARPRFSRSARASSCRGSASPINGIKRYARRRFGRGLPTLTVLLRRWCH
jgi:hypothetical protein